MLKQTRQPLHAGSWYSNNRIPSLIQQTNSILNLPNTWRTPRNNSIRNWSKQSSDPMLDTTTADRLLLGPINTLPNLTIINEPLSLGLPTINISLAALLRIWMSMQLQSDPSRSISKVISIWCSRGQVKAVRRIPYDWHRWRGRRAFDWNASALHC